MGKARRVEKPRFRWSYDRRGWQWMWGMTPDYLRRMPQWIGKCVTCGAEARFYDFAGECKACKTARVRRYRPLAQKAHRLVRDARLAGQLQALDGRVLCVDCKCEPAAVYDHRSYAKPLEVDPVCRPCNVKRGPAIEVVPHLSPIARYLRRSLARRKASPG